ncbi:MAG: enoyl-CoA hydratase/isomerase family protein [Streptosporangiaceae bacterium]|nr:enoyl-CoA hydratase/isomerase family protein [Streptosporangiaceae bacterium]
MPEFVRSENDDRVVTITLDSPANRNALSSRLITEFSDALSVAAADQTAHAVRLTHTGPAFSSGAALDEMRGGSSPAAEGTRNLLAVIRQLLTLPIPVVAQVNGATRAGGLGLLGACDVVLASTRSTFAFSEVRLGLAPAVISLPLRPLLTARAASLYFLTGETFDAVTAAQIGLVTAAGDDVGALVQPVLDSLRRADRQGLRETRPLTTRDRLRALDEEGAAMTELSGRLFASPVAQEHFAEFFGRKGQ